MWLADCINEFEEALHVIIRDDNKDPKIMKQHADGRRGPHLPIIIGYHWQSVQKYVNKFLALPIIQQIMCTFYVLFIKTAGSVTAEFARGFMKSDLPMFNTFFHLDNTDVEVNDDGKEAPYAGGTFDPNVTLAFVSPATASNPHADVEMTEAPSSDVYSAPQPSPVLNCQHAALSAVLQESPVPSSRQSAPAISSSTGLISTAAPSPSTAEPAAASAAPVLLVPPGKLHTFSLHIRLTEISSTLSTRSCHQTGSR
ncbi:hypothetical protein DFH09DRAFT_1331248 [Mycena vulgaris]|nr:hypothetical protein DFH09DRAFT_1331248 [Mycena vulgaris]